MCMDGIERLDSQISPDKVWFMLMSSSYKTSLQIMKMRSRGNPAFTREISSRRSRACCSLPAQLSEKATCPSVVVYSLNHALFFCNPVDCGQPGSSVHGLTQLRILEWVHFLLQGIFLTQGSNPHILHWQVDFFLPLSHLGKLTCPNKNSLSKPTPFFVKMMQRSKPRVREGKGNWALSTLLSSQGNLRFMLTLLNFNACL